jgi:hypothetical protein
MDVMTKKAIWIGLAVSALGLALVSNARADDWNKKTVLTFTQPVEVSGHVLPAGTYTFKLATTLSDRHIVQIFNADGSTLIATVTTIPNYRLESTDQTVIKFREVPAGSPEAIKAWFYPGATTGQEFVYPKHRAVVLAKASRTIVPAIAAEAPTEAVLKTSPIIAITAEAKELPVAEAIQTVPLMEDSSRSVAATGARQAQAPAPLLPATASPSPLIVLLGSAFVCVAIGLAAISKYVTSRSV